MSEHATLVRDLHVPLEAIFEAFTAPRRLKAWLRAEALVDPRLGGAYVLRFGDPDGAGVVTLEGAITAFARPEHLAVAWEGDPRSFSLQLAPSLGGTRLSLTTDDAGWWTDALGALRARLGRPQDP